MPHFISFHPHWRDEPCLTSLNHRIKNELASVINRVSSMQFGPDNVDAKEELSKVVDLLHQHVEVHPASTSAWRSGIVRRSSPRWPCRWPSGAPPRDIAGGPPIVTPVMTTAMATGIGLMRWRLLTPLAVPTPPPTMAAITCLHTAIRHRAHSGLSRNLIEADSPLAPTVSHRGVFDRTQLPPRGNFGLDTSINKLYGVV